MSQENPEFQYLRKKADSRIKKIEPKEPEQDWKPFVGRGIKEDHKSENSDKILSQKKEPLIDKLVEATISKSPEEREALKLKKMDQDSKKGKGFRLSGTEILELRGYRKAEAEEEKDAEAAIKILAERSKLKVFKGKRPPKLKEPQSALKSEEEKISIADKAVPALETDAITPEEIPVEVRKEDSPAPEEEKLAPAESFKPIKPQPKSSVIKKPEILKRKTIEIDRVSGIEEKGGDMKGIKLTSDEMFGELEVNESRNELKNLYRDLFELSEKGEKPSIELRAKIKEIQDDFFYAFRKRIKEQPGSQGVNSEGINLKASIQAHSFFDKISKQVRREIGNKSPAKKKLKPIESSLDASGMGVPPEKEVQKEKNIEDLIEKGKMKNLEEIGGEFYHDLKNRSVSWRGDIQATLETQTKVYLRNIIQEYKMVDADKEAELISALIKNIIK